MDGLHVPRVSGLHLAQSVFLKRSRTRKVLDTLSVDPAFVKKIYKKYSVRVQTCLQQVIAFCTLFVQTGHFPVIPRRLIAMPGHKSMRKKLDFCPFSSFTVVHGDHTIAF